MPSVARLVPLYFLRYLINGTIFGGKMIEPKNFVMIFPMYFFLKHF